MTKHYEIDMVVIVNDVHQRKVWPETHLQLCLELAKVAGWESVELNQLAYGLAEGVVSLDDGSELRTALRRIIMDFPERIPREHALDIPHAAEFFKPGPLSVTAIPAGAEVPNKDGF